MDLSARTQDLQKISRAIDTDTAARAEKVSQIKNRIDQGAYTVDAGKIAANTEYLKFQRGDYLS